MLKEISVLLLVKQSPVIVIVGRKSRCVWCQCVCIYVLCLCGVWQDNKSVGARKGEVSSGDHGSRERAKVCGVLV